MSEEEARARFANQSSQEEKIAAADVVIDGSLPMDETRAQVAAALAALVAGQVASPAPPSPGGLRESADGEADSEPRAGGGGTGKPNSSISVSIVEPAVVAGAVVLVGPQDHR